MRTRLITVAATLAAGSLALAACSSTPSTPSASAHAAGTHSSGHKTTTTSTAPAASTTTLPTHVANLPLTDQVRAQLIAIAAQADNVPVSQVVMQPGLSYYAYDPATSTFWAGAAFGTTPGSANQSAFQDADGYFDFSRTASTSWQSRGAGLAGTPCPDIPAAVVALWNWTAGTCNPPASAYPTTPTAASDTATTAAQIPSGFALAKSQWQQGANSDAADENAYWSEAATDLTNAEASAGSNASSYANAVTELKQLETIPEMDATAAQQSEAQSDTAALNTFFDTPGLYS